MSLMPSDRRLAPQMCLSHMVPPCILTAPSVEKSEVHCFLPLNIAVCCFDFSGSGARLGGWFSLTDCNFEELRLSGRNYRYSSIINGHPFLGRLEYSFKDDLYEVLKDTFQKISMPKREHHPEAPDEGSQPSKWCKIHRRHTDSNGLCDFGGLGGMSGGEYVSLGYFERDDLASVRLPLRIDGVSIVRLAKNTGVEIESFTLCNQFFEADL